MSSVFSLHLAVELCVLCKSHINIVYYIWCSVSFFYSSVQTNAIAIIFSKVELEVNVKCQT